MKTRFKCPLCGLKFKAHLAATVERVPPKCPGSECGMTVNEDDVVPRRRPLRWLWGKVTREARWIVSLPGEAWRTSGWMARHALAFLDPRRSEVLLAAWWAVPKPWRWGRKRLERREAFVKEQRCLMDRDLRLYGEAFEIKGVRIDPRRVTYADGVTRKFYPIIDGKHVPIGAWTSHHAQKRPTDGIDAGLEALREKSQIDPGPVPWDPDVPCRYTHACEHSKEACETFGSEKYGGFPRIPIADVESVEGTPESPETAGKGVRVEEVENRPLTKAPTWGEIVNALGLDVKVGEGVEYKPVSPSPSKGEETIVPLARYTGRCKDPRFREAIKALEDLVLNGEQPGGAQGSVLDCPLLPGDRVRVRCKGCKHYSNASCSRSMNGKIRTVLGPAMYGPNVTIEGSEEYGKSCTCPPAQLEKVEQPKLITVECHACGRHTKIPEDAKGAWRCECGDYTRFVRPLELSEVKKEDPWT